MSNTNRLTRLEVLNRIAKSANVGDLFVCALNDAEQALVGEALAPRGLCLVPGAQGLNVQRLAGAKTELTLRDKASGQRIFLTMRDGAVVGAMGSDPQRYIGLTEAAARHKARYARA